MGVCGGLLAPGPAVSSLCAGSAATGENYFEKRPSVDFNRLRHVRPPSAVQCLVQNGPGRSRFMKVQSPTALRDDRAAVSQAVRHEATLTSTESDLKSPS
ncbi:hypothetical protein AMIS_44510 [Actinoplanes missouriensis 431]|uniref:Uncharacterized protein n=1 Tax=Actinoplanes missouriensis (strain ATCC 14538 / DSM 43046 / CBS 188.64 / JCM 3121 / NBRC 102363 / NCIMB 12654 / NRRL B-3342 / UNCC 431) TaxID=512565 RepID=I0H9I4_ACTM4|nr:hypothetical protein AMIS_44510 [Actinoplanes missouriensis 431]